MIERIDRLGGRQQAHLARRTRDGEHDRSSCWCCCLDCEDLQPQPCPICAMTDGHHDTDDPRGHHAAARALIPAHLKRPSNTARRWAGRPRR